jgi:PadR family transcriptional regulator, regulatory protein PadR
MPAQVRPSVFQLHSKTPVDGLHKRDRLSFSPVDRLKESTLSAIFEVLQGTLDLLVLEILDSMGTMHGFGTALHVQQVSEDLLRWNQGMLIASCYASSNAGRSSPGPRKTTARRTSSLIGAERKELEQQAESWFRMSAMINRVLRTT